jgi:glycosyltransferase involved in cell wall biosynthesis
MTLAGFGDPVAWQDCHASLVDKVPRVMPPPSETSTVLHTITDLNIGGAELMLARFIDNLGVAAIRSSVLSLMPAGSVGPLVEQSGARVVSAGMTSQPRIADMGTVLGASRNPRPDLVHGWMYHGNLAGTLAARLSLQPRPVIWSIHHTVSDLALEKPSSQKLIRLLRLLSRIPVAISYCSYVAAQDHARLGFSTERATVIPNGTDCAVFKPDPAARARLRSLLGIPASRKIVGHAARYHPMKDQACLVRAMAEMLAGGQDIQCVFFGAGHADGPVRSLAGELGISDRVTTLGVREDMPALLPGLDVFALCSAWGEAFSLAVSEAMACGVPCVATTVGDTAWLIGDTGRVVKPRQPAALAAALTEILRVSEDARRSLGADARQRIISQFSLDLYTARHLDLYREAWAQHGAPQPRDEFA